MLARGNVLQGVLRQGLDESGIGGQESLIRTKPAELGYVDDFVSCTDPRWNELHRVHVLSVDQFNLAEFEFGRLRGQ